MPATPAKPWPPRDTLNIRIKPGERNLIDRAAELTRKTRTDFVLEAAHEALVKPGCGPPGQDVHIDECCVGGTRGGTSMVLVVTETTGGRNTCWRVRLAHAENNDQTTLNQCAGANAAIDAAVTTTAWPATIHTNRENFPDIAWCALN